MEQEQAVGFHPHEAWEMTRELYLLRPEERGIDREPMPENEAFSAMVEMNRELDRIAEEDLLVERKPAKD